VTKVKRPVSKWQPATGMSSEPFLVGRKVKADRADAAGEVDHARTERRRQRPPGT
jgi:hypothetical protein